MSIFKKIFGGTSSEEEKKEENSPFLQKNSDIPVDELFMTQFVKNGGKFLYCTDIEDIKTQFENILEENDWFEKMYFVLKKTYTPYLMTISFLTEK